MVERKGAERQLGHVVREGECIFDIIVLVENGRSRFGSAESCDCSDFDCGYALLIFIFNGFRGSNWGTNVNDGRRLLGDTRAGDEAINNGLHLGPSCLSKVHFHVPVHIIEVVVSVC